jgi:phosphonatase-like hydrolase
MFEIVAFDVAGTTVRDDGLVIRAFERAFSFAVPELWQERQGELTQYALDTMGQSKIEVFTAMLGGQDLAEKANIAFEAAYLDLVLTEGVEAIPGASETFEALRRRGVRIALTTGFSRGTLNAILKSLGWQDLIDVTVVPGEAGAGRPSPKMLQLVAEKLGSNDLDAFVVVGDTISDMEAGVNFGAAVRVGVLTGAHDRDQLVGAGATAVIESVVDLPNLLFN